MPTQPHQALVESASRGDSVAVSELLERHYPQLLTFVRLHAGPWLRAKESCSDLAQSVCLEVLQDLSGFEYRGEPQFRKWLFQKTLSKITDRQRYYSARKRNAIPRGETTLGAVPAAFASPSQAAIQHEELERLAEVFPRLPEEYRQVITYARIIGLSHVETGVEMGRSPQAVASLLYRAMARLAWLMEEGRSGSSAGQY